MLNLFLFYFQSFSSSACLLDHMDIVVVTFLLSHFYLQYKPYVRSPSPAGHFSNCVPDVIRLTVLGTRYFCIPLTTCACVLGWS